MDRPAEGLAIARVYALPPVRLSDLPGPSAAADEGPGHPPLSLHDALRLVQACVVHYNNVRLNSAIGYVTPKDVLAGRQQQIHAERDRKLKAARQQRQSHRQQAA